MTNVSRANITINGIARTDEDRMVITPVIDD